MCKTRWPINLNYILGNSHFSRFISKLWFHIWKCLDDISKIFRNGMRDSWKTALVGNSARPSSSPCIPRYSRVVTRTISARTSSGPLTPITAVPLTSGDRILIASLLRTETLYLTAKVGGTVLCTPYPTTIQSRNNWYD